MPENKNGRASAIKLSTVSHTLAVDVQHLLLRLGIIASVKEESQAASGYRSSSGKGYVVIIDNIDMTSMFVNKVGFMFDKQEKAIRLSRARVGNAQGIDLLPRSVNGHIREMQESGMSWKDIGWREQGKRMTRRSALAVAERTGDKTVAIFANSSVMWDEVVSVTLRSYEMTYDLTVDKTSNFVVNDIITHNSGAIEQDADVVAFLYFEPDDVSRTLAQVMFDKNRFGPRGLAKLVFTPEFTRFREHIPAAT
jgi:replicative DNA helicase